MSAKNTNKLNVPEARAAMDKFKMEARLGFSPVIYRWHNFLLKRDIHPHPFGG